jgi:hypothetical protein
MRATAAGSLPGERCARKDFEPRPPLRGGRILLLSERLVLEVAYSADVLGNDVAVSAELVLIGG